MLASLLGAPGDVRAFMDLNPLSGSKTPAWVDQAPEQDPTTWAWAEPGAAGFRYLAGHVKDPQLAGIAGEFDTLVYDLPARIIPLEWAGRPVIVTRGDEEALTRITMLLSESASLTVPIVVVNEAVTQETTKRARHLTVGMAAWARVVHLARDPALHRAPWLPQHAAASTKLAAAQIAAIVNERKPQ